MARWLAEVGSKLGNGEECDERERLAARDLRVEGLTRQLARSSARKR
jgi:hypothetical protein